MASIIVEDVVELAKETGVYCFDVEHRGDIGPHHPEFEIHGVGFRAGDYIVYEQDKDKFRATVCTLFADPDIEDIAYNGKYDLMCLIADKSVHPYDLPYATLRDPMVALNLLDDNRLPSAMSLAAVVKDAFGETMLKYKDASDGGLDTHKFKTYAKNDVKQEYRLWDTLKPKLVQEKLWDLFTKILMPVSCFFAEMEYVGMKWDLQGAKKLLRGFQVLRDTTEKEIFDEIGVLNLNSGDQVAKRLFEDLGFPTRGIPKTPKGHRYAVDAKVMDKLAGKYPICDKIRTYRTADKMNSTYIEPITRKALNDSKDRIHSTFWIISATGRTRSNDPNLQNIPAWLHKRKGFEHLNIRKNLLAEEGNMLLVADLSQIELRMIAHITQDKLFLKAYRRFVCTRCETSGEHNIILHECPECGCEEHEDAFNGRKDSFWHGEDIHQQTYELVPQTHDRQGAKTANFALVYNATAWKMHSEYPDLSVRQWEDVIEAYFASDAYYGVHQWHIRMQHALREHGECTDVFGRKRRITRRDIARSFKHALNQFINFGPQCSACQLIELSMVKMRADWIKQKTWLNEIRPVNFVHDEIVLEVHEDKVDKYKKELRDHMELSVQFKVPIRAEVKVVKRWGSIKE